MGYTRHHAIVVSSWNKEHIDAAHRVADELKMSVSEVVHSEMNGILSFFVAPDGSKEGWEDSDIGDVSRSTFKAWIRESGFYLKWVEVQYGDDEHRTKIIDFGSSLQEDEDA